MENPESLFKTLHLKSDGKNNHEGRENLKTFAHRYSQIRQIYAENFIQNLCLSFQIRVNLCALFWFFRAFVINL